MRLLLFLLLMILSAGCVNSRMDFAKESASDTLSLIYNNSAEGKFIRVVHESGKRNVYSGMFWVEGHNCWVFPWHGLAYDGTGFYITDSGMVNLGIRKNLFGKVYALYVNEGDDEYERIK